MIGENIYFVIVIGGDGNMFGMVRVFVKYKVLLIGINCGNFGFLIDIVL